MEKWKYLNAHPDTLMLTEAYAITSVVYDPQELDINGDPKPNTTVRVTMVGLRDAIQVTVPITVPSLSLLPSQQQRALEKEIELKAGVIAAKNGMLAEHREEITRLKVRLTAFEEGFARDHSEIKALKASLQEAKLSATNWEWRSNQHLKEVKRLETVCGTHYQGKQDAEQKWVETVGELDNARQQLKEVRVANGKLMDTKHELEKHSRGLETIVESQGRQNALQAAEIQKLKSILAHINHQYEGKCQEVRDLKTQGSAKERDEYSKALNIKDTQISQITKQAAEWYAKADRFADQRDAAERRVRALEAEKDLCLCSPKKQTVAETLSLNKRVSAVEARVTKLEEADGFPMESYNIPMHQPAMLFMGNHWTQGVKGAEDRYCSNGFNKSLNWDLANQPTRWKPMPK